jgi:adenylate kinase
MNVIMLGPPGAGKGTQAQKMADKFQIPQVSTGDLLRASIRQGTDLGKQAKAYMDKGELVPDSLVIGMVKQRLSAPDCKQGFNLDGFPRAVAQAEALDKMLGETRKQLDHVISIEVPEEELVRRLTGRRSCPKCSAMFHVVFSPPKKEGICDSCGEKLIQRSDDNEATIRNRIEVYKNQTEPLKLFYEEKGLLRRIDGLGTPKDIERRISKAVGSD